MRVTVFTMEGCIKCEMLKDQLKEAGIKHLERDAQPSFVHHEGWREDGSFVAKAVYEDVDSLPIVVAGNVGMDYDECIEWIKSVDKCVDNGKIVVGEPAQCVCAV